jgi:Pectinacetylesterase
MVFRLTATLLALVACAGSAAAAVPSLTRCESVVAFALRRCVARATRCDGCTIAGAACGACDEVRATEGARLTNRIQKACNSTILQNLGFGALATPAAMAERLHVACTAEADALYARTAGGPQGAALTAANRTCLSTAHRSAAMVIDRAYKTAGQCARRARQRGASACDMAKVDATVSSATVDGTAATTAACSDLRGTIGLTPTVYVDRARQQSECLVATAHGETAPLELACGPRNAAPAPPRGQWVQVVLDEATWGTRCGDGSSYAFWLRLAPEGAPVERAMVHLQGGGVCIFESDCAAISGDLYEAQTDYTPNGPTGGIFSTDPAVNPFADWTMMALPYCTQDVHFGGGGTSAFPSVTVHRFGGLNVRSSLQYLRDVLWATMEQTSAEGYRPDRPRVLFVGESAGGFGVMYNYHYLLDDLQWAHTTAVPDSSVALDSGGALSIALLGVALSGDTGVLGWGFRSLQPSYCIAGNCGVGPILMTATAPRLKAVPEQQMLTLSNQNDGTQVGTTFFPSTPAWISALRTNYCGLKGQNGLRFFLPAETTSIHTMLSTQSRYTGLAAGGGTVRDFLADAINAPDGVVDRVDEGAIASTFGVPPIACLP